MPKASLPAGTEASKPAHVLLFFSLRGRMTRPPCHPPLQRANMHLHTHPLSPHSLTQASVGSRGGSQHPPLSALRHACYTVSPYRSLSTGPTQSNPQAALASRLFTRHRSRRSPSPCSLLPPCCGCLSSLRSGMVCDTPTHTAQKPHPVTRAPSRPRTPTAFFRVPALILVNDLSSHVQGWLLPPVASAISQGPFDPRGLHTRGQASTRSRSLF